jgi:hypothetical protein
MRNSRISRAAAALSAFAAVAAVAVVGGVAQAAPPAPGQSLSVTSGTQSTTFTVNLATGQNFCPGDATTAGGGWRWHQYIVNRALDVETVRFLTTGPVLPTGAPAGSLAQNLYSTTGSPQSAKSTLAAGTGQITGATTLNYVENVGIGLPAGQYKIGFVCTNTPTTPGAQPGTVGRYWETPITVTSAGAGAINWTQGWAPGAPTGFTAVGASSTGGQITGTFTAPAGSDPAVSSYTVTATPQGGGAPVSITPAAAGAYTITGLTNGTTYDVTVTATNSVGTGPAATVSNVAVSASIAAPTVTATGGVGQFTVNWTPAAPLPTGAVLASHTVTVTPAVAGSPFTVPAGTNTLAVTAAPGTYSVTVQGVYNAGFNGAVSSPPVTVQSTSAFIGPVIQEVTVVRPAGALVLTQRCGVFGSAPAFNDNTFGPLPALPAQPADADPNNGVNGWTFGSDAPGQRAGETGPSLVTGTDAQGFPTLGGTDPRFGGYPYPVDANQVPNPNYPTHCGINLGTASLLTTGQYAGSYFAATGRINQVHVVDTRDGDAGWTLNGRMGTFKSTTDFSDTFHGNHMGWNPEVTWRSAPTLGNEYTMVVNPGPQKDPVAEAATDGLRDVPADNALLSRSLSKANAGAGLGMAVMDARLRLLIPVTADAGTYKGTLTFTVA